jgi:hypothetical protein
MRTFGTSRARGRRAVPRAQAPLVAVLSTPAGDHPAALIDVSRTGARLKGELLPQAGEQLIFRSEDVQASGDVVWSSGDHCAVEFESPIAVTEVQRLRSLGAATRT